MANFFDEEDIVKEKDGDFFNPEDVVDNAPSENAVIPKEIPSGAIGATVGAGVGKATKEVAKALESGLGGAAENIAFQVAGLPQTKEGKRLQELLPEEQIGKVSKKQLSRKLLDEGLLPGLTEKSREKDLRKILEEGSKRSKAVSDYLENLNIKVPTEKVIEQLDKIAQEDIPEASRFTKESSRKLNEITREKKRLENLLAAGKTEFSLPELEEAKRAITSQGFKPDDISQTTRRRTLKTLVDDAIKESMGPAEFEKFQKMRLASGESSLLTEALRGVKSGASSLETAAQLARTATGGAVTKASGISSAIRAAGSGLAKAADVGSKGLKAISPITKHLPLGLGVLGAYGGYESARAEGLEPKEAGLKAAMEIISPIPLPSEKQVQAESEGLRESYTKGFGAEKESEKLQNEPGFIIKKALQEGKEIPLDRKIVEKYTLNELKGSQPDKLNQLGEYAATTLGDLSTAKFLRELANKPEQSRNALLFSATQNPEIRKKLLKVLGVDSD